MSLFLQDRRPAKRYVSSMGASTLGVLLVLLALVIIQNIVGAWPESVPGQQAASDTTSSAAATVMPSDTIRHYLIWQTGQTPDATWDFRLILIALWFGALGSLLHSGSSFVRFVGNRQLVSSWVPWYLVRPVLGAGLAMIFYVVVRAGFATAGGTPVDQISHFTVAAFAGMIGLFTERATRKLSELFETLFAPSGEEGDADPLVEDKSEAAPQIEKIDPDWVRVGNTPVPVFLTGENLSEEVVLKLNGVETQFERRDGRLEFALPANMVARKGSIEVTLSSAGRTSEPKQIVVSP